MMVDNWFGIVRTIPPRGRDSRNQIQFIAAVECSSSKPGIEATHPADSGPPIRNICTMNNTRVDKTPGRKKERLQRFLDRYSVVPRIVQQNPPSHKTKFWIVGEALEYGVEIVFFRIAIVVYTNDDAGSGRSPASILRDGYSPTLLINHLHRLIKGCRKLP